MVIYRICYIGRYYVDFNKYDVFFILWIFFLVCGIGVVYDKNYIGGDMWIM